MKETRQASGNKTDREYFYGHQADQFAFFRIPKIFFTDPSYKGLSAEAKILYGLMLDRMGLSVKNGWLDEDGRVFIIYSINELVEDLGFGRDKISKILTELEAGFGLIERRRRGLCLPNIIYVKDFLPLAPPEIPEQEPSRDVSPSGLPRPESAGFSPVFRKSEIPTSGNRNFRHPEVGKSDTNNTEENNTYVNNNLILSGCVEAPEDKAAEDAEDGMGMHERDACRDFFKKQLEFDAVIADHPLDAGVLGELLELVVDTVCSRKQYIFISGESRPAGVVKSAFMKLRQPHLEYVLYSLKAATTKIGNIRQYLLAALYNAPFTMCSYYQALVSASGGCAAGGG